MKNDRVEAELERLRAMFGEAFENERKAHGWTIRQFATHLSTSVSQAQRLLHKDKGGNLTLRTIVRTAASLSLKVQVRIGTELDHAGLNAWRDRIHKLAVEKGGWPTTAPTHGAVHIALIHGEVSEVMEALRKPELGEEHLAEEVADAIGRLLDFAGAYNLDIEEALKKKYQKNKGRPYLHGKKF